jgi:hypothetical protein
VFGDFNGDGIADVATLNAGSGDISLLLGRADGQFEPARTVAVGAHPISLSVLKFNKDGLADLVVTFAAEDGLLLLSNGDGAFTPAGRIAGSAGASAVAVGDFNRDGVPDIVVGGFGATVRVLLGTGAGFQPGPSFELEGFFPGSVLVADLNGDGNDDVVANVGISLLAFIGKGDGSFESARPLATASPADGGFSAIGAADLDGDGRVDLAVTRGGGLSLLINAGGGTFGSPVSAGFNGRPSLIAAADLNGDGKTDLAISIANAGTVSALINQR